jgi:hypothetical protein
MSSRDGTQSTPRSSARQSQRQVQEESIGSPARRRTPQRPAVEPIPFRLPVQAVPIQGEDPFYVPPAALQQQPPAPPLGVEPLSISQLRAAVAALPVAHS